MATYRRQRYLLMAVDPIHIGTGGYRLGRVDNSIVREPGTRVPKIPGSSIHGAARSYAARLYENLAAAGQDQRDVVNPECDPVCYTFGYLKQETRDQDNGERRSTGYSGVIRVFDASLTLFPVYSMAGPVWISTPDRLVEAGFQIGGMPVDWPSGSALYSWKWEKDLNLGWLMLEAGGQFQVEAPEEWRGQRWDTVKNRLVLVQDGLFGHIVNSNLEVRTSVSIDPERGAAEDGALFTYEALPRSTFLALDVVADDYRDRKPFAVPITETTLGNPLPGKPWEGPLDVFEAGLGLAEWLGIGGMSTRGFGRLAVVGAPLVQSYGEVSSDDSER